MLPPPTGAEPLAQVGDRSRPERDVHVRIELEQALALRFGVAAADGDHLVRIAPLDRSRLCEVRRDLLIRLFADRWDETRSDSQSER